MINPEKQKPREQPPETGEAEPQVAEQIPVRPEEVTTAFVAKEKEILAPFEQKATALEAIRQHPAAKLISRLAVLVHLASAETALAQSVVTPTEDETVASAETETGEISPEVRAGLLPFLNTEKDPRAKIEMLNFGAITEETPMSQDSPSFVSTQVEKDQVETGKSIVMPNDTLGISMQGVVPLHVDEPSADWKISEMTKGDKTLSIRKKEFTDSYGNKIRVRREIEPGKDEMFEGYLVILNMRYAKPGAEAQAVPLSLDLSPVGGPSVEGVFSQPEVPWVGRFGPVDVYSSDFSPAEIQPLLKGGNDVESGDYLTGMYGQMERGITKTAQEYGLRPKELVRGVHIVDTNVLNASALPQDVILIHDGWLRNLHASSDKEGQYEMIRHESEHIADARFHISDDPRFAELFDGLPEGIRNNFDEGDHYNTIAGHAGDNVREFFASSRVNLENPEYWASLPKQSVDFVQANLALVQIERTILAERDIPQTAKIFRDLQREERQLQELLQQMGR